MTQSWLCPKDGQTPSPPAIFTQHGKASRPTLPGRMPSPLSPGQLCYQELLAHGP